MSGTKNPNKRFVDQPNQWRDVTPKAVKQRQDKEWAEFYAGLQNKKASSSAGKSKKK